MKTLPYPQQKSSRLVFNLLLSIAIGMILMVGTQANASFLEGQTITETYHYPNIADIYDSNTFTVGPGPLVTFTGSNPFYIYATDNSFTIDFSHLTYSGAFTGTGAFNGMEFADTNNTIQDFANVILQTNLVNLTSAAISFTPNSIFINFLGSSFTPDSYATLVVSPSQGSTVPEPSTYILLSIALGVVGYARKRMNKQV
jgi:hypothetical protein